MFGRKEGVKDDVTLERMLLPSDAEGSDGNHADVVIHFPPFFSSTPAKLQTTPESHADRFICLFY